MVRWDHFHIVKILAVNKEPLSVSIDVTNSNETALSKDLNPNTSNKTASSDNESMLDDHAYCKLKNITNESQESINLIQKIKETNK